MQTLSRMPRTPAATERPAFVSSPGLLATADGTLLHGPCAVRPVAAEGDLIFTTAATGWGEILTDPSYEGQIVVLTHPMAGNYRIDPAELESDRVHARALVVTRLVTPPAGDGLSLEELLAEAGIPALEGIDTRALTLALRRGAARRAVIRPAPNRGRERRRRTPRRPGGRRQPDLGVGRPRGSRLDPIDSRRAADRSAAGPGGADRLRRQALAAAGARRAWPGDHGAAARRDARPTWPPMPPDLVVLSPGPGDPSQMHPQIATVATLAAAARPAARRSWASAWVISCWRWPPARRRAAWRSVTTAATTR